MAKHARVIKGDIVYSESPDSLKLYKDGYIVLFGNIVRAVYKKLPDEYRETRLFDYSNNLILPGFNNSFISLDSEYLSKKKIVKDLWQEGVLRFNIISIDDLENSYKIMDYIESLGLGAYCTHQRRKDSNYSIYDIDEFSVMSANKRFLVNPFIYLEEADQALDEKIKLSNIYNLKIIGKNIHNLKEISNSDIMNIIDFNEMEIDYNSIYGIDKNAYNPYNLGSLRYKDELKKLLHNEKLGIYTENNHSILEAIRYELNNNKIFTLKELFYMTTIGSGKFYGNIGKFEEFHSFDANIVDDSKYSNPDDDLEKRLDNFIKYGKKEDIILRYVYGMKALGE